MFGYVRSFNYVDFLNPIQEEEFQRKFAQLEQQLCNSSVMSKFYSQSKENFFLDFVLRGYSFLELQELFPEELEEALRRTAESRRDAIIEWEEFTRVFFANQERPVPGWPGFIKIQLDLGTMGQSEAGVWIKQKVQASLLQVLRKLRKTYPKLEWARRRECYLEAALWDNYILPNGDYSCSC